MYVVLYYALMNKYFLNQLVGNLLFNVKGAASVFLTGKKFSI